MFNDELILIFSGMIEKIADQKRLVQIARHIDPLLPENIAIDHRILTSHFRNEHRLYDWINAVLKNISTANIPGIRNFLYMLEKEDMFYNHNTKCIELLDKQKSRMPNWGLLNDGDTAYTAISRIKLEKTGKTNNEVIDNFYNYAGKIIPKNYGRIWNQKSGNITASFFPGDKVSLCLDAAFEILLNSIFFNLDLPCDDFLRIRISCAVDFINYSKETKFVSGDAVKKINALEDYMQYNSIIIPESMYLQLEDNRKSFFTKTEFTEPEIIYQFSYQIGRQHEYL